MTATLDEKTFRRVFRVSLFLKAAFSQSEIVGGVFGLFHKSAVLASPRLELCPLMAGFETFGVVTSCRLWLISAANFTSVLRM